MVLPPFAPTGTSQVLAAIDATNDWSHATVAASVPARSVHALPVLYPKR